MDMDLALVSKIPFFLSVPDHERRELLDTFTPISYDPGEIIAKEGDLGESFYVIIAGEVEIIKAINTADERSFGLRSVGDFIGEMSLLEKQGIRSATVRTVTPVKVLGMNRNEFHIMLQRWPNLAVEMLHEMSVRLRSTEQATIHDLQEKNLELTKAYTELKAAQEQIIEKERLEKELQVARRIQSSFLPQVLPGIPGYDFGARILPARAVGGDLYDFIRLGKDKLGILIGDVSDKGVPAALFMALTRSLLRVEAMRIASPVKLLQRVNQHLMDMQSEEMFVTVLYGLLDLTSGEFRYARAGHEIPVFINSDRIVIECGFNPGQMLGLFPGPLIDEQVIQVRPGSKLLFYTDGATDATNARDEQLDRLRLIDLLQENFDKSAQQTTDNLLAGILAHQGKSPQFDDITLVVVNAWPG
jgi:serine phosphatase RsbU (regulator of sigma subunit)